MFRSSAIFIAALLSQMTCFAGARLLTATEMIVKAEQQIRGKSTQSLIDMVVHRPNFTRTLALRAWTTGTDRALVEIIKPVKERGVTSLRVANEMWNYLPNSDQVVRIPSSLMLQSWMGSDFSNDDLMKASSIKRDYTHRFIGKGQVKGEQTLIIECLPKKDAPVVWGRIKYWARKKDSLPVKQEFYDDSGNLVRTFHFSKFKKMDDRVVPTVTRVDNAQNKGEYTTVTYHKIFFDRRVPATLFDRDRIQRMAQQGQNLQAGWFFTRTRRGGF